jgi:hypothetical protein
MLEKETVKYKKWNRKYCYRLKKRAADTGKKSTQK